MTSRISILPSGHEFDSEGETSLLEAGLGAGLRLAYGCSNGNCGACLARVVSGEVKKTRHHDYVIGEARKTNGYVLMCCNTAQTDVILETSEASNASEIPQQKITAKVKKVMFVNDDVALLHLRTPRTNRLRFLAGQHVSLGGNGIPKATHTIASCPCDDMHLHFQIPSEPATTFSDYVFNHLQTGDRININGPNGDFILDEESNKPLVFIAWHTGFAPIRSLIEHAMALEVAGSIHFIWMTESNKERYLDNLCRSWTDAFDNFHYYGINEAVSSKNFETLKQAIEQLKIKSAHMCNYDFYIAGNERFLCAGKEILMAQGLPEEQLSLDALVHT